MFKTINYRLINNHSKKGINKIWQNQKTKLDKLVQGSFLFLGPTGVGKTEVAKILTRSLFDTYKNLILLDMSEYMENIQYLN